MQGRQPDELNELHAHLSSALLACSRCIDDGRLNSTELLKVAKLLSAAQMKLHQCRRTEPPTKPPR
jgi:hypothetical protein